MILTETFIGQHGVIKVIATAVTTYEQCPQLANYEGETMHITHVHYNYLTDQRPIDEYCDDTRKAIDNVVEDIEKYCDFNGFNLYSY
ncbi:hypothetical protein [Elizabethkingia phage TCUEAP1]|nr:hypothetical protein [Elizabethkingia phage TCUEAP1]